MPDQEEVYEVAVGRNHLHLWIKSCEDGRGVPSAAQEVDHPATRAVHGRDRGTKYDQRRERSKQTWVRESVKEVIGIPRVASSPQGALESIVEKDGVGYWKR